MDRVERRVRVGVLLTLHELTDQFLALLGDPLHGLGQLDRVG